ncbi:MAG: hypothetical protein KJT03_09440, partial [Verrucomicrobiae bacterium]|nr:hypothetical protein [Verrucomicrobiae bacterium]
MSRLFRFLFLSAIFTQAFTLEADPNDHTWTHIPLDEVPEGAPAGWQGFDINSIADMAQDGSLLLVGQPESLWLWTRESGYRSLINNESIPGLSGYQLTGIDARWGEDGSYVFWGSAIDPDGLASDTVHHFFGIGDPAGSAAIINQSAPGATEYSAFSAMQVNTLGDRLFTKQEPGVMPQLVFQKSGGGEVVLAQEGEAPVVDPRNDAGKNPVIRSFTETLGWSDYLFLELEIEDTDGVYRAWYLIN